MNKMSDDKLFRTVTEMIGYCKQKRLDTFAKALKQLLADNVGLYNELKGEKDARIKEASSEEGSEPSSGANDGSVGTPGSDPERHNSAEDTATAVHVGEGEG